MKKPNNWIENFSQITGVISAWLTTFIGLFLVLCWQTGHYDLLTFVLVDGPIPYPSAIGVFVCGLSFLNIIYPTRWPLYRWLAAPVSLYAVLRLIEIVFKWDLGLTSFLIKTLIFPPSIFPPTLLLGTFNSLLISLSLLSWPRERRLLSLSHFSLFCNLIVILGAAEGFLAYLLPIYQAPSIPIHFIMSICQIILGVGLLSWGVYSDNTQKVKPSIWLPYLIGGSILFVQLAIVMGLYYEKQRSIKWDSQQRASEIQSIAIFKLTEISNILNRVSLKVDTEERFDNKMLTLFSNQLLEGEQVIRRMTWVNADFLILNPVEKELSEKPVFIPLPITKAMKDPFHPSPVTYYVPLNHRLALYRMFQIQRVNTNFLILNTLSPGFPEKPVFIPLPVTQAMKDPLLNLPATYYLPLNHRLALYKSLHWKGQFQGALLFELDLFLLFSSLKSYLDLGGFFLNVHLDNDEVYSDVGPAKLYAAGTVETTFSFADSQFRLTVIPTQDLPLNKLSNMLLFVFSAASIISSLLIGIIFYLYQSVQEKARNIELQKEQLKVFVEFMRIINKAESIASAMNDILHLLHNIRGWQLLLFWQWHSKKLEGLPLPLFTTYPGYSFPEFEAVTRQHVDSQLAFFSEKFKEVEALWSVDFGQESSIRSPAARQEGVKGYFALPIYKKNELMAVVEFFRTDPYPGAQDKTWLELSKSLGEEFILFIEHKESESINAKLMTIATSSYDAICVVDSGMKIEWWNHAAERLYGWSEKEALGLTMSDLNPSGQSVANDELKKVFEEKKGLELFAIQRMRKDGSLFWANMVYSPIFDVEEKVTGVSIIVQDVTQQVLMDKSKNEFISMVSHELRTPLTSIIGGIGLLKDREEMNEEAKELLALAYRNAQRLVRIINDILDVEKMQLGKLQLNLQPVLLSKVVEEALKVAQANALTRQITLIAVSMLPSVKSLCDYNRLLQVMDNFLSNAIKFSYVEGTVEISMEIQGKNVRISVTDHGVGIPIDLQKQVFNKFFQVKSGDTHTKGTGLGLNISKHLIQEMGGTIGFVSEPYRGSTFYFELPIYEKDG